MIFEEACKFLRSKGYSVTPSDIPGLTLVGHQELTVGQVISLAMQLQQ